MDAWLKVLFPTVRDVYVDGTKCGVTNVPFNVQLGTHTITLGDPQNYKPANVTMSIDGNPANPTIIVFELASA